MAIALVALTFGLAGGVAADQLWPAAMPNLPVPLHRDRLDPRLLERVRRIVATSFYASAPSSDEVIQAETRGLVNAAGDPLTTYLSPRQVAALANLSRGVAAVPGFDLVHKAGNLYVARVDPGSAAERAGLVSGYRVLSIDGRPAAPLRDVEAKAQLAGAAAGQVRLRVTRFGVTLTVDLPREGRPAPASIATFQGARVVPISLASHDDALRSAALLAGALAQPGAGVVLDLRGRFSGDPADAALITDLLLPDGIAFSLAGVQGPPREVTVAAASGRRLDVPVVALIDGYTGGPAELAAGALQERHRVRLVGDQTLGRCGEVTTQLLPDGGALVARASWCSLAGGRRIDPGGLSPDVATYVGPPAVAGATDPGLVAAVAALAGRP